MSRGGVAVCVGVVLWAWSVPAGAEEASEAAKFESLPVWTDPPEGVETEVHWYGWQTILTDLGGLGMLGVAGALQFEGPGAIVLASAGVGTLFLGAPVVHLAHGRYGVAALSLGLRLGLPALATLLVSRDCSGECSAQMGFAFIGIAPLFLDATLLSLEQVPVQRGGTLSSAARSGFRIGSLGGSDGWTLEPMLRFDRHSGFFGVRGSF